MKVKVQKSNNNKSHQSIKLRNKLLIRKELLKDNQKKYQS
jgi:hypothetical protein